MKLFAAILFTLAVTWAARAQLASGTFPPSQAYAVAYLTLASAASANTNTYAIGATNRVDSYLYHNIHVVAASNLTSYCIDKSIDGTNWVLGATNAYTIPVEVAIVGKIGQIRARTVATNSTFTIKYLGGR